MPLATFRDAIDGFLAGRLTVDDLARAVPLDPAAGPGLLEQLALRLTRGELPREVFDSVNARLGGDTSVPITSAPSVATPPADADDRTRLRAPAGDQAAAAPDWQQQQTVQAAGAAQHAATAGTTSGEPTPSTGVPGTSPDTAGTQSSGTVSWYGESKPVAPGMVLRGRFVLETVLGSGGMGTVFKARDLLKEEAKDRNPHVAVKVLGQDFRQHPSSFLALQREANKSQKLAHPNIVTVYDFDRDGPVVFMHMEFLDGKPLDALIRQQRAAGGMQLADCWHIIDGMCKALAYAHEKGIVHADFKPGNVFLTNDDKVKVLDFGIARVFEREGQRRDTTVFDAGSLKALTYSYASCEMLEGADPDPRDDIYALACVIVELLTGHHPFRRVKATDARDTKIQLKRIPGLNRRQWRALSNALAFDREHRTPDVMTLYRALSIETDRQRRRTALAVGGVAAAIVAGIVLYWTVRTPSLASDELPPVEFVAPTINSAQAGMLLDQAEYYLEMTAGDFDVDLLTEGVSNANDAFQTVLAYDAGNARAVEGRREIARRLAAEARARVAAGDEAAGRRLVIIGLRKVDRDHRDLLRLYRRIGPAPEPDR